MQIGGWSLINLGVDCKQKAENKKEHVEATCPAMLMGSGGSGLHTFKVHPLNHQ